MSLIHIIGGGLAGSEAAWQAAQLGIGVCLHEMRGVRVTQAHQTDQLAELVCSNSLRSDDWEYNAVGLLHQEMRLANSLIMRCADAHKVPAGGALAVDREGFARAVTETLSQHPLIDIRREEITEIEPLLNIGAPVICATGPLTSEALSSEIARLTGQAHLSFFDAIAPIIHFDSIDMSRAWRQSRYDKGETLAEAEAYINCALDRAQYEAFVDALLSAPKTAFKDWENVPYFDGCLPVEVMAERGRDTLRYGPLKPVGLTNAHQPEIRPYAVIQLRQDNALGTLYNMVGFQTKMTHGAQVEVFRTIPGLEQAQFARLGGLHRNTFIQSPKVLDTYLRLNSYPALRFAGQVTGVEGYVESAAIGLLAGRFAAREVLGRPLTAPPEDTALGALLGHITGGHIAGAFQPMNINYGLLPPLEAPKTDENGRKIPLKERGRAKKRLMSLRAIKSLESWLEQ